MSQHYFESINPLTGASIGTVAAFDDAQIERALQVADEQARLWARSSYAGRSALLGQVADQLDARRDELAALITREMGKLVGEARAEVEKCATVCRYYAEHGPAFLGDELAKTDSRRSLVAYQPLGVVLAVMPWNFPLWQVMRFAAPAIAAGNVGLLKHASNVMGCAQAIERIFRDAGAPEGLFTNLPISSAKVSALIADRRVRAVTLTGSEPAGRAVAGAAGKALKKSVLELGGSDPFVVLDDADMENTVRVGIQSRYMNAGQSCIAAKRFIVLESVADDFTDRFVSAAKVLKLGDPMDGATQLAPMAREDLRDELHQQVAQAKARGASVLAGGQAHPGPGFFYRPTVLTGVTAEMAAYSEELFGPAAVIYRVADEKAALRLANDTDFGLGGSVWTQDRERGLAFARRMECGLAFVNELVKSDPRVPFGGIKSSGYGRELALHGIREFVNCKTILIN